MIAINENSDFSDVDQHLVEIADSRETDLEVPLRFTEDKIGFRAAVIQLIITWAREQKGIHIVVADKTPEWLTSCCAVDHGLIAVLMAPSVESPEGLALDPKSIKEAYDEYRRIAIKPREAVDGALFLVTNVFGTVEHAYDHLAPKTAQPEKIASFKDEVKNQLERCIAAAASRLLTPNDFTDIAEIVYELFANAEEWGCKDIDGSDIEPNARGIIFKIHRGPFFSQYDETPPGEYLNQWQAEEKADPSFLEISIFDSGVGLAQHKIGKRVTETTSLKEEYDNVMHCLRKYSSASGRSYRGLGLHYVMSLLTRTRGFLRYRSGHLSLFRNFYRQPLLSDIGRTKLDPARRSAFRADNIYFFDWRSGSLDLIRAPSADGALFTLLFPLRE